MRGVKKYKKAGGVVKGDHRVRTKREKDITKKKRLEGGLRKIRGGENGRRIWRQATNMEHKRNKKRERGSEVKKHQHLVVGPLSTWLQNVNVRVKKGHYNNKIK